MLKTLHYAMLPHRYHLTTWLEIKLCLELFFVGNINKMSFNKAGNQLLTTVNSAKTFRKIRLEKKMNKHIIVMIICLIGITGVFAQNDFRILTYNALNFSGNDTDRTADFALIFSEIDPDIVMMQEITNQGGADLMLSTLNQNGGGYAGAQFVNGPSGPDVMLFFRSSIASLQSQYAISTNLRNIMEYVLNIGDHEVRLYGCHLKASQGEENERYAEALILRNHLSGLPAGTEFLVMGDLNLYRSSEPAYGKLTDSEADNSGRSRDLSTQVGNWHDNPAFASIHSQSPRTQQFGGGATGGMDDRFDFILSSYNFNNGVGIEFTEGTYTTFGNDGQHFNTAINNGANSAVSTQVANALHDATDHLPVYADFTYSGTIPVVTIDYVQSNSTSLEGQQVTVEGVVTIGAGVLTNQNLEVYLQDDSEKGITLFDAVLTTQHQQVYQRGNLVRVSGLVTNNFGKTQLTSLSSVLVSSGEDVTPIVATTTEANTPDVWESTFLQVHGFIDGSPEYVSNGWNFELADDNGTVRVRIEDATGIDPQIMSSGQEVEINGVLDIYYGINQLVPGYTDDIWNITDITDTAVSPILNQVNCYPNPFNPELTISFSIANKAPVQLSIYNIKGEIVHRKEFLTLDVGSHNHVWESGNKAAVGIYFVRLKSGNQNKYLKATLLK